MGDEIEYYQFTDEDYRRYYQCLEKETRELGQLFDDNMMSTVSNYCGLEQEAWILNSHYYPEPENQLILETLNNKLLSPELAKFNIELNVTPQLLRKDGLSKMQAELESLWSECDAVLHKKNLHLEMIGILPTVRDDELVVENMSEMKRYRALNEQVLRSRGGKPLMLDIVGVDHLKSEHADVMLESAATSLQLHRQIDAKHSARYYNASVFLSAVSVAISANSPFLFGKQLWDETRIPLFEQAVEVGGYGSAKNGPVRRVSFGTGYVKNSVFECYSENLAHFPVLLPACLQKAEQPLPYLRMHNGTIWRWNRPIIGFDENGTVHVRIEHRVIAAGPTIIDEMANAAFFFGLQEYFATHVVAGESMLSFSAAKDNFYNAAQHGLSTKINWPDLKKIATPKAATQKIAINTLIKNTLLSCAEQGLTKLGIDKKDTDTYLGVINARVQSGQTGAEWQKKYAEKNQYDMQKLTKAYRENRLTGQPVHAWPI